MFVKDLEKEIYRFYMLAFFIGIIYKRGNNRINYSAEKVTIASYFMFD